MFGTVSSLKQLSELDENTKINLHESESRKKLVQFFNVYVFMFDEYKLPLQSTVRLWIH